jgi:hypothetical protein
MDLDVVGEFAGLQLGDYRRERRTRRVVQRIQQRPTDSFPKAMANRAEREAFYRLMESEDVTPEALFAPHAASTAERCEKHDRVLVVHDTTTFSFRGDARQDLGKVSSSGQGFIGHFSVALSADGRREPLGALAVKTWARTQRGVSTQRRQKKMTITEARNSPRESLRWLEGALAAEAHLSGRNVTAIHVMDSEGDDYALFDQLASNQSHFVIRGYHDRVMKSAAGKLLKVKEFIATAEVQVERMATLSPRKEQTFAQKSRKRGQPRTGRLAKLAIRAERVDVRRPNHAEDELSETRTLNVVYVREIEADVVEPVDWLLYTTEPIDSAEDVLRIVDFYRARWSIEEFFKALKTGCAFQSRQLEPSHSPERARAFHPDRVGFASTAYPCSRLSRIERC